MKIPRLPSLSLLGAFVLPLAVAAQPVPGTGTAKAGPAGQDVVWLPSVAQATEEAKKSPDTRILLAFVEPGCGDCERMGKLVYPSTSFYSFTRDKLPVFVDRTTPEGKVLAEKLRVETVPAWVVITPDRLVCGRVSGLQTQTGWFQRFTQEEQDWATYRKVLALEAEKPGEKDLVFAVAEETYRRLGDGLAEPRFARLAADASAPQEVREKSLAYLASIQMDRGQLDEAEKTLGTLLGIAKDPQLVERAELRLADLDLGRGDKQKAIDRLTAFKAAHPTSPALDYVERILASLKGPQAAGVSR